MIPDYGRYYGCVFSQLFDGDLGPLRVEKIGSEMQGFYLLDGALPIYIKFCRNRKGPWSFNFHRDHQREYKNLARSYTDCIVALVCGADGVVALNGSQLEEVLSAKIDEQEVVSVRRKLGHMYSVAGVRGALSKKVGRDSLIVSVREILRA